MQEMECLSEHLYEALIGSTEDFIYMCNMKTGTFRFPPALVQQFEMPGEIVPNPYTYWKKIIHPEDLARFLRSNMEVMENRTDTHCVEFRAKNRSGEYVWLRCRGQLIREDNGNPELFAGIMEIMGRHNKIDPVTQLLNQKEFLSDLMEKIEEEGMERLAVLIIDVDEFRQVNELYSREEGDRILKVLGQAIQSLLPDNAGLYRLEKDSMGILMDNGTEYDIKKLYGNIQGCLTKIGEWRMKKIRIEVSAGCAMYPKDGETAGDLHRYAEYALEQAKILGKNRLEFFSQDILQIKLHTIELMRQMKESITQGYQGFYMNYQPQVDAQTRKIIGVEALMRWKDPKGGGVPPTEFIPVMEEHGMIYQAGLWMLQTSLRAARKWIKLQPDICLSVNISALQLLEDDFLDDMFRIVEQEKYPCQNLVAELTESYTVKDMGIYQDKFNKLREHGIRIAMDDFGTGYSSLEVLKNAPIDIVKIDKVFMKDILKKSFDATFISFVVALCHDVGIEVCLEGVETEEEYRFLKSMNLDSMQGYLFGKPVADCEIEVRLKKEE